MQDKITVSFTREELPLLGCLLEKGFIDASTANPLQGMLQERLAEYGFEVNPKEAIGDRQIRAYLYRRFQIAVALVEAKISEGVTAIIIDPLSETLAEEVQPELLTLDPTSELAALSETKPVDIYAELAARVLDKKTTAVTYQERVVCKSEVLYGDYKNVVPQEVAEDNLQTAMELPDVESFFD